MYTVYGILLTIAKLSKCEFLLANWQQKHYWGWSEQFVENGHCLFVLVSGYVC